MGCFLLIPYFFIDINKTVICHLSLLCIIPRTLFIIMSIIVYFFENTESRSHRVFIYLSVSSYNLIFFSVTLCLCVHISFNVFKYKSYSRHLFYSFHGFEFLDESFKS